jgi:hypothetical protein
MFTHYRELGWKVTGCGFFSYLKSAGIMKDFVCVQLSTGKWEKPVRRQSIQKLSPKRLRILSDALKRPKQPPVITNCYR